MDHLSQDRGLKHQADLLFEQISPYEGDGLRNHCRRLYRLVLLLLEKEQLILAHELVYAAAMVHDLGLVSEDVEGAHYLERSLNIFRHGLRLPVLEPSTRQILDQCLLFNHRLRPVPGNSLEAECFRRAVWVEHTRGVRRFGLERDPVREVFQDLPRANLDRVLADFALRVLRHEPRTLVRGIFF